MALEMPKNSLEAAALVTIGEIYSMNGKKDEARKAYISSCSRAYLA